MAADLTPCPGCTRHVRTTEVKCPFCAATLELSGGSPPALPAERLSRAATFGFQSLLRVGAVAVAAAAVPNISSCIAAYGGPPFGEGGGTGVAGSGGTSASTAGAGNAGGQLSTGGSTGGTVTAGTGGTSGSGGAPNAGSSGNGGGSSSGGVSGGGGTSGSGGEAGDVGAGAGGDDGAAGSR